MHACMHATHHPYTHLSCSCQQQVVHVTAIAVRSSSFLFTGVSQLRASTTRIREGMEDAQRQLQKAVETMMDTIHRSKLAPIAKNAYLNMSKCYDQGLNDRQSQECVHSHARHMEAIQSMMQNELNQLQNRLQRGQQSCQDEVQDKFSGEISPADQAKAQSIYEKCCIQLVQTQTDALRGTKTRIEKNIDSIVKQK